MNEVAFSLTDHLEEPERRLLEQYYKHMRETPDARYLHWNMHSADYGFVAIDKRYKYLTGDEPPYIVPKETRYDLDSLIESQYGANYADHPKLGTLCTLNEFNKRYFLTGKEEAERFDAKEYGDIRRSTTEKAHLVAFLGMRFLNGDLVTKTSGPRVQFARQAVDAAQIILHIGERFETVRRQLVIRYGNRSTLDVKDEYDAQDLFHSLLRLFFDDVRNEEWTPSYAGGNKRADFLLPGYAIAIELKHSRPTMTSKDLGDQLVVDVENYKRNGSVRIIICLVFDREGHIRNPAGIERDLTMIKDGCRVVTRILT